VELSQFDQNILEVRQHLNFFLPNAIYNAAYQTDLAISGNGFFTVRDPVHNVFYATQYGAFQLDPAGRLIDTNGYRVQGITNSALEMVGDIVINANGVPVTNQYPVERITNVFSGPGGDMTITSNPCTPVTDTNISGIGLYIDYSGEIDLALPDGTTLTPAQILLQNYQNLQALIPTSGQLYSNLPAALPMFNPGIPGTLGLGTILSGCLEFPTTNTVLQLPPHTGLRLLVSGLLEPATVETSTDLISWSVVGQVTGSVLQDAEFFDTNSTSSPTKFYRVNEDW
jgi:hypothetical protein